MSGSIPPIAREELQRRCRDAATALEPALVPPEEVGGGPDGADILHAWLTIRQLRIQRRWLDAAITLADRIETGELRPEGPDSATAWMLACCDGWVQRAAGPFRRAAEAVAPGLPPGPEAIPALVRTWRITGERRWLDDAVARTPAVEAEAGDLVHAAALRALYEATGDPELIAGARAAAAGAKLGEAPVSTWPLLADLLDLDASAFEPHLGQMDEPGVTPAIVARVAASLALPPLVVRVDWHIAAELGEGPVSEAATFPYPALRVRFRRLERLEQVRFVPFLGGVELETILDAGVVGAGLDGVLEAVDRSPFAEGIRARGRGMGLLRRR